MKRKRSLVYLAGWAVLVALLYIGQFHRAARGEDAHFHTQVTSVLIFALLVVLAVWGGMMAHQFFERVDGGADG